MPVELMGRTRKTGAAKAIRACIRKAPKQFTSRQILSLLERDFADITASTSTIAVALRRMRIGGELRLVEQGRGPIPDLYEIA